LLYRQCQETNQSAIICNEDKYWWSEQIEGQGVYFVDVNKVSEVRQKYHDSIIHAIYNMFNVIIIDHINPLISNYESYLKYGIINGYQPRILQFPACSQLTLFYAQRSYKPLKISTVMKMYQQWEIDVRAEFINLVEFNNLIYANK